MYGLSDLHIAECAIFTYLHLQNYVDLHILPIKADYCIMKNISFRKSFDIEILHWIIPTRLQEIGAYM